MMREEDVRSHGEAECHNLDVSLTRRSKASTVRLSKEVQVRCRFSQSIYKHKHKRENPSLTAHVLKLRYQTAGTVPYHPQCQQPGKEELAP